jgi:hypothetical protein
MIKTTTPKPSRDNHVGGQMAAQHDTGDKRDVAHGSHISTTMYVYTR